MGIYICPVCGEKLNISGKSYVCANRHSFDISRHGYVNLLLSKHAVSGVHGDNKLMVQSRRVFLEKGFYQPLCDELCTLADEYADNGATVLDAGCGEGYYTSAIVEKLDISGKNASVYGIDISKAAVEYASRRSKNINCAVASVFHIPVETGSCDMLVTLFAPYCGEEYLRVLRSGGVMLMAIPSTDHLWELKQAIYDTPYKNEVKPYELEGFEFLGSRRVRYMMCLENGEDIRSLFSMTPYFYKTGIDGQERLSALENLETQADFELLAYRKDDLIGT